MIYTVTLNPSLDYIVDVKEFTPGRVNRTSAEQIYPGGKGINVSIMLAHLGQESTVLGFLAGFTGREIERRLQEQGIRTEFIPVSGGMSRINVKLRGGQETEETEINGMGPMLDGTAMEQLYGKLDVLKEGDTLVLAGSVPSTAPGEIYADICRHLLGRRVRVVVDTTGEALQRTLRYHPYLIKPNHHELGALFGVELQTRENVVSYAKKLQDQGAVNVLVSLGKEGAVLVTEGGEVYTSPAPEGIVRNAVGAGDSMVAGFLAGLSDAEQEVDYKKAFYMGLAAGSASAFSEALADRESVERLYQQLQG